MSLITPAAHGLNINAGKPDLASTVKHMAGMLWYEMLSELNKSGFSSDSLGTGGDDFQSMFLWNEAQNNFGKYDTSLTNAAIRQEGGTDISATSSSITPELPGNIPAPLLQNMPLDALANGGDASAIAQAAAVSTSPGSTAPSGDLVAQAKSFAKSVWPQITAAAQALGVPAVAVLAQTALETGWGNAAPGNNLFGIKASDGQASTTRATHEVIDGVLTPQTAAFRNYASTADSVSDYVSQILSAFPNATGQNTVNGFANALQQGGYATDANYAAKIVNISQSPLMSQVLDAVQPAPAPTPSTAKGPS
jgi:flagellar protein FlgJ